MRVQREETNGTWLEWNMALSQRDRGVNKMVKDRQMEATEDNDNVFNPSQRSPHLRYCAFLNSF